MGREEGQSEARYIAQRPSAWPRTGIRVVDFMFRTRALEPRGMTRSMYWSRVRSIGMGSRVVSSWMEALGTEVGARAAEIC